MSKVIFELEYADYDVPKVYYFEGPDGATQNDFEKLCKKLLPEAGYKAYIKRVIDVQRALEWVGCWVYWNDVVESLGLLLEEHGYQPYNFPGIQLKGEGIIGITRGSLSEDYPLFLSLGFAGKIILDHNYKLEKKRQEEYEAKKAKRGKKLLRTRVQLIK